MYRVAPAVATIFDFPDFQGAVAAVTRVGGAVGQFRRGGDAPRVHGVAKAAVSLDRPGRGVCAVGATKFEAAMACLFELGLHGRIVSIDGQRDHFLAGGFARLGGLKGHGVHALVLAGVSLNVELQKLADHRVAITPPWTLAGLVDDRLILLREHVGQ
ncbi:hypothetical protein D3C79_787970 [compost metagenome]